MQAFVDIISAGFANLAFEWMLNAKIPALQAFYEIYAGKRFSTMYINYPEQLQRINGIMGCIIMNLRCRAFLYSKKIIMMNFLQLTLKVCPQVNDPGSKFRLKFFYDNDGSAGKKCETTGISYKNNGGYRRLFENFRP